MAVALYYTWDRLGRPVEPATPIRELVAQLKVAYPMGASQFGWYANEAHYQAVPPGDHTPYSADGWPLPDPQWVVFATDIMVSAVGGTAEAQRIFDHLLASGKDGSAPWLKYVIWQATIYDVRHGWQPQRNAGHFDHIHVSVRTDHRNTHLGSWSVVPEEDDMTPPQAAQLSACQTILDALARGQDSVETGYPDKDGKLDLKPFYARVAAEVVKQLPVDSGGGGLSVDQVTEIVRGQLDRTRLTGA